MESAQKGFLKKSQKKYIINLFPLDPERDPKALPQPSEDAAVDEGECSSISAHHRPSFNQLREFKDKYGISVVVTCLGPNENPGEIKKF